MLDFMASFKNKKDCKCNTKKKRKKEKGKEKVCWVSHGQAKPNHLIYYPPQVASPPRPIIPLSHSLPASSLFLHRCSLPPLNPLHCSTYTSKEAAKRIKEEERIKGCAISVFPPLPLADSHVETLGDA